MRLLKLCRVFRVKDGTLLLIRGRAPLVGCACFVVMTSYGLRWTGGVQNMHNRSFSSLSAFVKGRVGTRCKPEFGASVLTG